MIERWKCVGYCVHCSADQDESTFSKEWGHFEKSNDGCWARADSALARIRELQADLRQMKEAIYWALGERDDFPSEPEPIAGKYRKRYWWRTELRKRSGLPIDGAPPPSETSVKCQHRFEKFSDGIISCQDCGEPEETGKES